MKADCGHAGTCFSLTDATQVFPQLYESEYHNTGVLLEPEATCPERNRQNFTVCYYDSKIRPKLMDCDLGEGTYNNNGAYPLLYSGTTDLETYEFMFT